MESNSLTTIITPSNSIDAASIVPVVAATPDPNSIPIEPPKGSPPPPTGQLMPDVAVAEDLSSPMKVTTPPPETPSPAQVLEQPTPAEAPQDPDQTITEQKPLPASLDASLQEDAAGQQGLDLAFAQPDNSMFGADTSFKTEGDGDAVMHDHQQTQDGMGNGIHTEDSPHVVYPQSPNGLAAQSHSQDDFLEGPPAKRQKLDSVSKCEFVRRNIDRMLLSL